MKDNKEIGEQLFNIRKNILKKTLKEMSREVKKAPATLSRWEKNKRKVPITAIIAYCVAAHISLNEFFDKDFKEDQKIKVNNHFGKDRIG